MSLRSDAGRRRALCTAALTLVALSSAGCGSVVSASRGGSYERPPSPVRAGLLELRWRQRLAEPSVLDYRSVYRGGPATDGAGHVFVGSADGGLYALRTLDGALLWRFETLGRVDSEPRVVDETVYFGSSDGALYALEVRTGRMLWRAGTAAEVVHAPEVLDDRVVFVNGNDTVYAVNRQTGAQLWRFRRPPPGGITASGHAGLLRQGTHVYTGFSDGLLVCLDTHDGSVVWQQDTAADIENIEESNEGHLAIDVDTTPVVVGDTLFAASFTAGLYAFDAAGGRRRWRLPQLLNIASLGTDGHFLYASSSTAGLLKIDPYDGSIVWSRELASTALLTPTALNDNLLAVPTADRGMWLVRTDSGDAVDGINPGTGVGPSLAVLGDRLYMTTTAGVLYALRVPSLGPAPRN